MANNKTGANTTRALIILSSFLTACGSEPQPQGREPQRFEEFSTEKDLPACDNARNESIVYVADTGAYLVCGEGKWL